MTATPSGLSESDDRFYSQTFHRRGFEWAQWYDLGVWEWWLNGRCLGYTPVPVVFPRDPEEEAL